MFVLLSCMLTTSSAFLLSMDNYMIIQCIIYIQHTMCNYFQVCTNTKTLNFARK